MSRLRFRNLDVEPSDPVDTWPYEALVMAIERGALSDWRRIAVELRRRPWGRTAADLEAYLADAEESGVGLLLERALERARRSAGGGSRTDVAP